ncbi:MAG: transposase [Pseudonocardiaceae bacterium]
MSAPPARYPTARSVDKIREPLSVRGTEVVAEEREVISRELNAGSSYRCIGRLLKRDHTVISREVRRNGGRSNYRAVPAQRRADENRARPKQRLLETNKKLHDAVNAGLKKRWSPRQISKRLRRDFPDDALCGCRPRRFTCVCTYRRAASCAPSSSSPCATAARGGSTGRRRP